MGTKNCQGSLCPKSRVGIDDSSERGESCFTGSLDCDGEINFEVTFMARVGGYATQPTHPCSKCGRLHHPNGLGVSSRDYRPVYLVDGRAISKEVGG